MAVKMTNELEKQFFDTFGIEPDITSCYHRCKKDLNCKKCDEAKVIYPQITDHILLELILIIIHHEDFSGYPNNIRELKDNILKQIVEIYNKFCTCVSYDSEYQQMAMDIKQQLRTLFEGDTNDR